MLFKFFKSVQQKAQKQEEKYSVPWLPTPFLDAANLRDAISTFSYIVLQTNGYQSKAMLTRLLDYEKGVLASEGVFVFARVSEVKCYKGRKMSAICVCVLITKFFSWCVCSSATSNVNSCLETFGKSLISATFSLGPFFPPGLRISLCLWNICCVKKKVARKGFQSPRLKGINSSVSLLNCFKESVTTDAIIHEGWRNHLCVIELLFETLSGGLK